MKPAKTNKRLFIIEPNLTGQIGHSLDFVIEISRLLRANNFEVFVILQKGVSESLLPDADRMISNRCFEKLDSRGRAFHDDLEEVNKRYQFKTGDKILIPTAYTNEIAGIIRFQKMHKFTPSFYIIIHQLYPPSENFLETHRPYPKMILERRLLSLLASAHHDINVFCTDSIKLRGKLSKNGKYRIESIAFPYNKSMQRQLPLKYDLTFLGDNRFEKSLYLLTKYLTFHHEKTAFLQITPPRGYPEGYRKMLETNIDELNKNKCIRIWPRELTRKEMEVIISQSKAIVLPYHPLSYDKRVSGLFTEAIFSGKPIIASEKTWVGDQVTKGSLGTTFKFSRNTNVSIRNLEEAIDMLEEKYKSYQINATKAATEYQKIYSYKTFLIKTGILNG